MLPLLPQLTSLTEVRGFRSRGVDVGSIPASPPALTLRWADISPYQLSTASGPQYLQRGSFSRSWGARQVQEGSRDLRGWQAVQALTLSFLAERALATLRVQAGRAVHCAAGGTLDATPASSCAFSFPVSPAQWEKWPGTHPGEDGGVVSV